MQKKILNLCLENIYKKFELCGFGRAKVRRLFVIKVDERLAQGFKMSDATRKDYEYCKETGTLDSRPATPVNVPKARYEHVRQHLDYANG